MSRETLNLAQAAEHVHMAANERGGEWYFEHRALDEWAQRSLLAAGQRTLAERHRVMMDEHRRADISDWGVARFFSAATIDLAVAAKAKAGILRDMTDLADRGGQVNDADALFKELVAREEAASTAIGEGDGTRHFFLIGSTDHAAHLHILARLAMLAHGTDLVKRLEEAADADAALAAIGECEAEFSH